LQGDAAAVHALNRVAHFGQCPAIGVRLQAHAGSLRARIHGHRVIGRRLDAAEAWIRSVVRIAVVAVELGRAFAELLVLASFGKAIVLSHRFAQTRSVYSNLAGKRLNRDRLNKIAARDELAQAAPSRRDPAE